MASRERGRLLLGAFTDPEAAVAFADERTTACSDCVRARWSAARAALLATSSGEPDAHVDELEAETLEALAVRMEAPLFLASIAGHQWRLARVPLAALLTGQPLINLDRVAAMAARLRQGLLPLLFPSESALEVRAEAAEGPMIALIADRGELVVSGAEARWVLESGAIEVVFRVEPRPNYASVLRWEDRLVVRNGHHRFLAAWQAGLRNVPCVLIEGETASLLRPRTDRFALSALRGAHPPRLVDLAAPGPVCLDVDLRRRRFVTQVRAEQHARYDD